MSRTMAFVMAVFILLPLAARANPDRVQIEQIIREYIIQNPEIIAKALSDLQRRAEVADAAAKSAALRREAAALLTSPDDVVMGNLEGDASLVEFFDFNCGYCKRAAPDVEALLGSDPKLRVVLKDLPVLGQNSVEAAKIGLAVKRLAGNKVAIEFHKRLMESRGRIDGQRAAELAASMGLDRRRIEAEAAGKAVEVIIAANLAQAERIGITGTPSFVIGDELLVGAVGQAPLREAVKKLRQNKKD